MAKFYEQLQKTLSDYEERPLAIITQQVVDETLFIIRGKDQGLPAWHYVLVPISKVATLKAQRTGQTIDVTKFGRVIQYGNRQGTTMSTSGWGTDPPMMIKSWIDERYGRASVDESISLTYEQDDIRLCTMQRAVPQQLLGYTRYYDYAQRFHYIQLTVGLQSTLSIRAGIKDYDRVISFNGFNIENDTVDQFWVRINTQRHLPVQMLVCSPATYAHYKANNISLHSDLPTVQRLKPVYATSTSDSDTDTPVISTDKDSFCAVQWENTHTITTVLQSAVFKSPECTHLNDVCFVETVGQYHKGKILLIGSYNDCEKMNKTVSICIEPFSDRTTNSDSNVIYSRDTTLSDTVAVHATLEQLPNEIFLYLFTFLDIQHLYNAFWGLNARLNALFQSYENLCLTFDDETDQLLMKLYAPHITRLTIDTRNSCDFHQFPNLQTLILCNGNSKHLLQIQPNIVPNLSHLSFLLGSKFIPPSQLVSDVFSNRFPFLRYINLGRIDNLTTFSWSTSPSLRFVSICSDKRLIISCVLASCPNLDHFQLHVFNKIRNGANSSPPLNHPLRRFTVWSDTVELTATDIDTILANTPNVQHFYLQTICARPFVDLANSLLYRLNHLFRFDCHVKETMAKDSRRGDITDIHQLHRSYNRIECIEEKDDFRIFATK